MPAVFGQHQATTQQQKMEAIYGSARRVSVGPESARLYTHVVGLSVGWQAGERRTETYKKNTHTRQQRARELVCYLSKRERARACTHTLDDDDNDDDDIDDDDATLHPFRTTLRAQTLVHTHTHKKPPHTPGTLTQKSTLRRSPHIFHHKPRTHGCTHVSERARH